MSARAVAIGIGFALCAATTGASFAQDADVIDAAPTPWQGHAQVRCGAAEREPRACGAREPPPGTAAGRRWATPSPAAWRGRSSLWPRALMALRWIYGDRAALDLMGREYYVSRIGGDRAGHDNIVAPTHRSRVSLSGSPRAERSMLACITCFWGRSPSVPSIGGRDGSVR
jgi:hypothetical protein